MPGNNSNYEIKYLDIVVKEDIPRLPNSVKSIIKKAIEERLIPSVLASHFVIVLRVIGDCA
jgi:hypothetical protein